MTRDYVLKPEFAPGAKANQISYEDHLSTEQARVVLAEDGPTLVIAGAGSGKTRTLTYRVHRLIERGVRPSRILLLTFTNRSAFEMVKRVGTLVGGEARLPFAGTFHAVGTRLLRQIAPEIGYPTSFGILDSEDGRDLMKQCVSDVVSKSTDRRFPDAGVLQRIVSISMNKSMTLDEVIRDRYIRFIAESREIERVLIEYQSRKISCGLMDFDDILANWLRVLTERPDLSDSLRAKFDHVLVDEYQDTNITQARIVDEMAANHQNVMVVGDDCQSIYSFRGAEIENIIRFPERHPSCQTFYLKTNYRSTPQIVELTNRSIARNVRQFKKELRAQREGGDLPALVRCADEMEQSRFVAQRVLELRDEGVALEDMAVLYRAHHHSMELQVVLQQLNIPFVVHSGQRFFEQRHIKDVLSFFRFASNPRDELAFQRVTSLVDGVGPKTAGRMIGILREHGFDSQVLASKQMNAAIPSRGARGWIQVRDLLLGMTGAELQNAPSLALDLVIQKFYEEYAARTFDNAENRLKELTTLANFASRFSTIDEFVTKLALASTVRGVDEEKEEPDEQLTLSTVHQAKGLEFHTVFVLWVTDSHFPSSYSSGDGSELEEERRLFYVATTRAKNLLHLMVPMKTWDRQGGWTILRESPFVQELGHSRAQPLYELWNLRGK